MAVEIGEKYLPTIPRDDVYYQGIYRSVLLAAYVRAGRLEEARGLAQQLLVLMPELTVEDWTAYEASSWKHSEAVADYRSRLRAAGLP